MAFGDSPNRGPYIIGAFSGSCDIIMKLGLGHETICL
jgi:hypothetical protein